MLASGQFLGLFNDTPEVWFRGKVADDGGIARLVNERWQARKAKDFARADAIRKELEAQGIVLEDGPNGTAWRRR